MKKASKTLAIVLCLAMILTVTALAAWPTYQGDLAHTGQITDATPPINSNPTVIYTTLPYSGSGWSGVDTESVMQTEYDGETYAYVLYNARSGYGGAISKVACSGVNAGNVIWYTPVVSTATDQLSSPILINDSLYYACNYEVVKASQIYSGRFTTSMSVSITTTLTSGGCYRLYVPSRMTATGTTTLSVKVTKPDNTSVYLNVDNYDYAETGSPTSRALTTNSTTSYLNKSYTDVFSAAGTYMITFEYTYSSGAYAIGHIYLFSKNFDLEKINDVQTLSPTISSVAINMPNNGQANTPITTDGTYIYFGSWMGGTAHGRYFQVKISDGSFKCFVPSNSCGFYWAGAVPIDVNDDDCFDYVVFGGDGGYLYYRSIADFEYTGGVYDLSALGNVTAGNVRSTISSDGTYIYFTSQGPTGTSYLWRFLISTIGSSSPTYNVIALDGGTSTSTPAISESGLIYVGYYNGFASGGIDVIISTSNTFAIVKNVYGLPAIQSSVDVYADFNNGYDYIYFTTNASTGAGYCYRINTTSPYNCQEIWNTTSVGNNACLQGMAACNGYLTFGNDSNRFYIVH